MRRLIMVIIVMIPLAVAAQTKSTEDLFEEATRLGHAGQYAEARVLCERILKKSPDNADVRLLYAQLFAWDKKYDEAKVQYQKVIDAHPKYVEAWEGLIDVQIWSDDPHSALRTANTALERNKEEPTLLLRKAKALEELGFDEEALQVAREAQGIAPANEDIGQLVTRLETDRLKNKIEFRFQYEWLNDESTDGTSRPDPEDWKRLWVDYTRRFDWGSLIGRAGHAWQFGEEGMLYEVDAYPRLGQGRYAYLSVGHGTDSFLPKFRAGAEYFQSLPNSTEFSLGVRYLDFDSSNTTIYTGTFGIYRGNYFVWIRPFVTPKDEGTSLSANLHVRRYFSDAETYLEVLVGGGSSPETEIDAITQVSDTVRQDSRRIRVEYQKRIAPRWIVSGEAGWVEEEFTGFDRTRWQAGVGIERLF